MGHTWSRKNWKQELSTEGTERNKCEAYFQVQTEQEALKLSFRERGLGGSKIGILFNLISIDHGVDIPCVDRDALSAWPLPKQLFPQWHIYFMALSGCISRHLPTAPCCELLPKMCLIPLLRTHRIWLKEGKKGQWSYVKSWHIRPSVGTLWTEHKW